MNHREVGRYWSSNAEAWTRLARAGYDVYRDYLNTPAFFDLLPNVKGMQGLDVGCGEGHNTRLLAQQGARVRAIDIAEKFLAFAEEAEQEEPLGIDYLVASAVELPFADETFDFATAFMSLMDIPELDLALAEVCRVLKPGGFLQFSISHPCFDTPYRRKSRDPNGEISAIEVGEYFQSRSGEITEWIFKAAPPEEKQRFPKFRIPRFHLTLSQWLNLLIETGFRLEKVAEPCPSEEAVQACSKLQDAQVVAYFLHVRVRKPEATH